MTTSRTFVGGIVIVLWSLLSLIFAAFSSCQDPILVIFSYFGRSPGIHSKVVLASYGTIRSTRYVL